MRQIMKTRKHSIILLVLSVIMASQFFSCQKESKPQISEEKKVNLANTFYNNELFEAAIKEYEEYLHNYNVDPNKQANTYFRIAEIYFERLHNYEKALEYYFRIKHLFPESKLQSEVGKKIVNCLERLERSQDAQRVLEKSTALDPESVEEHRPGAVIATIGDKQYTQGDLDFEIGQLPPYMQSQFNTKENKLDFLRQKIVEELLYDSAKRKGLEKDKEVIEGTFRAKKRLMAQKILNEELQKLVQVNESDVELYYKANKDKYAEKDDKGKIIRQKSLQEAGQQAAQDLFQEKQQQAYHQLMERLMKAENVKLFENRIK